MKLNLGAGNRLVEDWVNHDLRKHRPEIDIVWDLNDLPWAAWDNEQFDEIQFISVIEHLIPTPIQSLNECWRILKPGGILHLKYPLHTSPTIHDDPTHRWFLSPKSFDYVDPATTYGARYGFYTPYKWRINGRVNIKTRAMKLRLEKI